MQQDPASPGLTGALRGAHEPVPDPGGGTGRCGTKGALVHARLGAYGQQRVAAGGRLSSLEHPGGCREDWCFWSLKITRCWERAAGSARSTASASREREDVSAWKDGRRLDPPQATEEWSRVSLATGFQFFTPAPEHTGQQKNTQKKGAGARQPWYNQIPAHLGLVLLLVPTEHPQPSAHVPSLLPKPLPARGGLQLGNGFRCGSPRAWLQAPSPGAGG